MARLITSGFETQIASTAQITDGESDNVGTDQSVVAGAPTFNTTSQRSGAACASFGSGGSIITYNFIPTLVLGRTYFWRCYLRFQGLPLAVNGWPMAVTAAGATVAKVRMLTSSALRIEEANATLLTGTSATLSANTWYRVEVEVMIPAAGTGTLGLYVDGTQVARDTNVDVNNAVTTPRMNVGWTTAAATGQTLLADDVAINDDQGANQNGLPGPGKIVLLKPTSVNTRNSWVGPQTTGDDTTNLEQNVDNTPPTGTSLAAGYDVDANAGKFVHNITAAAGINFDVNVSDYTTAGLSASDVVKVCQALARMSVDSTTGTNTGAVASVSNPAITASTGFNLELSAVAGAEPTGWKSYKTPPVYNPSVTKGTSPVIRATKEVSSTRVTAIDLMGLLVEYAPVTTVERSAAVDAAASIATAGVFWTIFERAAALAASAAVESAGIGFTTFERSGAVGAAAEIASDGHGVLARSAAVSATGEIASAGAGFSIFERSASVDAAGAISSAGESETPTVTYVSEVTADSPFAWWRLGESSGSVVEEVNNAFDGAYVTGGAKGQTGAVGDGDTAVAFDGVDDYATLTTLGSLGTNITGSTCELWIKTTTATLAAVLGTRDTGTGMLFEVGLNTRDSAATVAGSTNVTLRGAGVNVHRNYITTNIYDGAWHHVVIVMQGATTLPRWWVDGTERTATTVNSGTLSARNTFDNPMALAARNNVGTIERYAAVTVDEVAFYTTQLSEARIQAHFNAAEPPGPTVFERSAGVSAVGAIASAGVGFTTLSRSAALTAAASIASDGYGILARSATVSATGGIASSGVGFSIFSRSASLTATGDIATSFRRALQRSASLSAAGGVASSAVFFSIFARSAALGAAGTIQTAHRRVLLRSAALGALGGIVSAGEISGIASRSASLSATASIQTAYRRELQRSALVAATATIASRPQRELLRQAAITAAALIQSSGQVPQALERAVLIAAVATIAADGERADRPPPPTIDVPTTLTLAGRETTLVLER